MRPVDTFCVMELSKTRLAELNQQTLCISVYIPAIDTCDKLSYMVPACRESVCYNDQVVRTVKSG